MSSYFNLSSPSAYLTRKASASATSPASASSGGHSPVASNLPAKQVELRDPLRLWMSDLSQTPVFLLLKRLKEIEALADALANYFEALANAHSSHASQLGPLAQGKAFQNATGAQWIPVHAGGYSALIDNLRETSEAVAAEHALVAKRVKEEVVPVIRKAKENAELKRKEIEKEVKGMPESVIKEREATNAALLALTESINSIVPQSAGSDPVLLRYQFDSQLKIQLDKENDLLSRAHRWTKEGKEVEKAAFDAISSAWSVFAEANSNMLLSNQQRSVLLSATVDSIPPDAEWSHFAATEANVVPADSEPQEADQIDVPTRDDPTTKPLREGPLERQKGWVKTWKPAHVVLTPSGNLHAFPSPVTSATTGSALKPILSVALSQCTLGPLANDETAFVLDGPDGKVVLRVPPKHEQGAEGIEKDREEWCTLIEKFTKDNSAAPEKRDDGKEEGDIGVGMVAGKGLPTEPGAPATPVKASNRAVPPLPPRSSIGSPTPTTPGAVTSPGSGSIRESVTEADIDASSLSLHDHGAENDDDGGDIAGALSSPRQASSHRLSNATSVTGSTAGGAAAPSLYSTDGDAGEDITSSSFGNMAHGPTTGGRARQMSESTPPTSARTSFAPSLSIDEADIGSSLSNKHERQPTQSSVASSDREDDEHRRRTERDDDDDEDEEDGGRPSPFEFSEIPDSPSRPSFDGGDREGADPGGDAQNEDDKLGHDQHHQRTHSKKSSLASVSLNHDQEKQDE